MAGADQMSSYGYSPLSRGDFWYQPFSLLSFGSSSFVEKAEAAFLPKTPNTEAEDEANTKSIAATKCGVDFLAMVRKLN